MKYFKNSLFLLSLIIAILGCKKGSDSNPTNPTNVYGCTDNTSPNYNPNANVNDGSCQYTMNFTSQIGSYNFSTFQYEIYLQVPKITQSIINNGIVQVSLKGGSYLWTNWIQLPYNNGHNFSFISSVGHVEIDYRPGQDGPFDVKIVIKP